MTEERKQRLEQAIALRQNNLTVILENVHDSRNVSAVMRTCDAIGIKEIFILNTDIGLHKVWGRKSSGSAWKWLTIHQFTDVATCVNVVKERYDKLFATHLASNAISVYDINFTERVALVFGNEHKGVSETLLQHCDGNFIIPQVGMVQSLNISVACAITLYEAFRQKEQAGHYSAQQLTGAEAMALMQQWSRKKKHYSK
ncbi:MAG TPA: RNA methyltransferase [Chitinophagaceae bacterium]|nr:RNA methyltransferase [Chitinophagaceae bacterium]